MKSTTSIAAMMLAAGSLGLYAGCAERVAAGPRAQPAAVEEIRKALAAAPAESTEAAGGEEAASEATGWATIKGTFKVEGTPPTAGKITADKDPEVCAVHDIFDESVVVKDGMLQGAVIFARTPKLPVHESFAATATEPAVLDNKGCRFEPHVMAMRSSQPLLIKNSDAVGHNSKIDAKKSAPINVSIVANDKTDQKLPKEEQLPVKVGCSIHPWMGGWILVRDDPYAAVSDDKGSFTLEKVPAGKDIEFQLWQEKKGFLGGVKCEGAAVDSKGRMKLKLEPDQELELVFTVPADLLK